MKRKQFLALLLAGLLAAQSGAALAAEIDLDSDENAAEEIVLTDDATAEEAASSAEEALTVGEEEESTVLETDAEDAAEESGEQDIEVYGGIEEWAGTTEAESGKCGDNLTWTLDSNGTLTISGTGEMYYCNPAPWYSNRTSVKNIIVKKGVASIGAYAFKDCAEMTDISLPDSIKKIQVGAFFGCSKLKSINIPDSVTQIACGYTSNSIPFGGCTNLVSVRLSANITDMNADAFEGTPWLENKIAENPCVIENGILLDASHCEGTVCIPDGTTYVCRDAFVGCQNCQLVQVPATVKKIGNGAFYSSQISKVIFAGGNVEIEQYAFCTSSLEEIVFHGDVTLTSSTFRDCSSLKKIDFEGNVKLNEHYSGSHYDQFEGCISLEKIILPEIDTFDMYGFAECVSLQDVIIKNNDKLKYIEKIIFSEDQTTLLWYPQGLKAKEYVIPNTVTMIGERAFCGQSHLENIEIPNSVNKIGGAAFQLCSKLDNVVIPTSVKELPAQCFELCESLNKIIIPAQVTSIVQNDKSSLSTFYKNGDHFTIYGMNGSYAESFAKTYGYQFESHTHTNQTTITKAKPGTDGKIVKKCSVCRNIDSATIFAPKTLALSATSYLYDGTVKKPSVTVKDSQGSTIAPSNYDVTYAAGRKNAGSYRVTATLKGSKYSGSMSKSFTIDKASPVLKFASNSVSKYTTDSGFTNALTKTTDGTISYSSSKPSVATVNSASGKVTIKGAGTTTITAKAAAGTNYNAGSASYKLTVTPKKILDLSALTYSFSNSNSAFGYGPTYKIPLSSYQIIFNPTLAKYYYRNSAVWGGSCYGMATTSGMFNTNGSGLTISGFSSSANLVRDLKITDKSNSLSITVKQLIEAMQISQNDYSYSAAAYKYRNQLNEISKAAAAVEKGSNPPIILVFGPQGGHALVGYKVEKKSSTRSYLYVYDCNYPDTTRYITLTTNSSGAVTGWYYYLNNTYHWGSSYSGCWISYVPYSTYQSIWSNRASANKTNNNVNAVAVNSDNFQVLDYEGNVIASMSNGELSTGNKEIIQYYPADLSKDINMIYLPTDVYQIVNKDSSLKEFEVNAVNVEQSANVTTTADSVTVAVDDKEELNTVSVQAEKGDTYDVVLNSTLDSASGKEEVEYSGTGTGSTITVGMDQGNCILTNCTGISMWINGDMVGSTANDYQTSISTFDASLKYTSCTYDGTNKEPAATLKNGSSTLKNGRDYVVVYSNNMKAGKATATFYGIGNYTGTLKKTFIINAKSILKMVATLSKTSYTYSGGACKPTVTLKNGSVILKSGADYSVSYSNNKNAGKATVKISGKGNYTGSLSKSFTIKAKDISKLTATLSKTSYIYSDSAFKPTATLKDGSTTLKKGTDYTVSYSSNKNVGTATAKIIGKGNYSGTTTKTFKINPKATTLSGLTAKSKGFTAKWKKQTSQTTGYQIQYSTNNKFGSAKIYTVKGSKTTSQTIKKLTAKKKYYVRIRTYKTVSGKNYYSSWSAKKSITTKK